MKVVLAVDGGNSKTYLALLRADGTLLALVRGRLSSPHHLGVDGSLEVLGRLLADAAREAGLPSDAPVADVGVFLLAGVDFPAEEVEIAAALEARQWAARTIVGNDTFAVLRAGTERGRKARQVRGVRLEQEPDELVRGVPLPDQRVGEQRFARVDRVAAECRC